MKREIEILRSLSHPSIIKLISVVNTHSTHIGIVIELVSGGDLFSLLQRLTVLHEAEAYRLFDQLVDVVSYLHALGITHRDLKLENILLDRKQRIKLIDFGVSSRSDTMRSIVGSKYYVAPEIVRGDPYTSACDVWGLGVILFTLLCGFLPFDHESDALLFRAICSGTFVIPTYIATDASKLISRMLDRRPRMRPSVARVRQDMWCKRLRSHAKFASKKLPAIFEIEAHRDRNRMAQLQQRSAAGDSLAPTFRQLVLNDRTSCSVDVDDDNHVLSDKSTATHMETHVKTHTNPHAQQLRRPVLQPQPQCHTPVTHRTSPTSVSTTNNSADSPPSRTPMAAKFGVQRLDFKALAAGVAVGVVSPRASTSSGSGSGASTSPEDNLILQISDLYDLGQAKMAPLTRETDELPTKQPLRSILTDDESVPLVTQSHTQAELAVHVEVKGSHQTPTSAPSTPNRRHSVAASRMTSGAMTPTAVPALRVGQKRNQQIDPSSNSMPCADTADNCIPPTLEFSRRGWEADTGSNGVASRSHIAKGSPVQDKLAAMAFTSEHKGTIVSRWAQPPPSANVAGPHGSESEDDDTFLAYISANPARHGDAQAKPTRLPHA